MLPELPSADGRRFDQFVTWVFYALILLLGTIVSSNFSELKTEVVALRVEITDLNTKVALVIARDGAKDKEISRLEDRVKALETKIYQ